MLYLYTYSKHHVKHTDTLVSPRASTCLISVSPALSCMRTCISSCLLLVAVKRGYHTDTITDTSACVWPLSACFALMGSATCDVVSALCHHVCEISYYLLRRRRWDRYLRVIAVLPRMPVLRESPIAPRRT